MSATPSPYDYPELWNVITVNGVDSPGGVHVTGWKREDGWDEKKGKGTKGATLTHTSAPPAKGKFHFVTWDTESFEPWDEFIKFFKHDPSKPAASSDDANTVYYPSLADIDVTQIVTKSIGAWQGNPLDGYTREIDAIEWVPPPPQSIVKTINASSPGAATTGIQPDPAVVAAQAAAKTAMAGAQVALKL